MPSLVHPKKINPKRKKKMIDMSEVYFNWTIDPYSPVFWSSFFIIAREGFEILLLTMIVYTTVEHKQYPFDSTQTLSIKRAKRYMGLGIFSAVIFSFILASVFKSHADAEAYETVVFLAASAMLFYISLWCHNASDHLEKFNRIITRGTAYALAFTVFVIFAREGFEIIMFYAALFAKSTGEWQNAVAGGLVGTELLFVIWWVLAKTRKKIPISSCFRGASIIMFCFALYFGAKGLHEFAEVNQIWWLHDPLDFLHEGALPTH